MAKKYDIHGFSYINDEKGTNTLNGTSGATWEEDYYEFQVACFNGLAYFKSCCGCYIMQYPKINELTDSDKDAVKYYCGFYPESGEYGVICGALGTLKKVTEKQFKEVQRDYPIKEKDKVYFEWLNGGYKTNY